MKKHITIFLFLFLFLNASLYSKDYQKTIIVTDSNSKPIPNAYIEIKHKFWKTNLFEAFTDAKGYASLLIPFGTYKISISNFHYNQFNDNLLVNDEDSIKYLLDSIKDLCLFEGTIKYDKKISCGFALNEEWSREISISFTTKLYEPWQRNHLKIDIDSLGKYSFRLPVGNYNLSFFKSCCTEITKNINFFENKHQELNLEFNKSNDGGGFLVYPFILEDGYYNLLDGLQFYPGIMLTKFKSQKSPLTP